MSIEDVSNQSQSILPNGMTQDEYKIQCKLRCYHEAGHLVYGLLHGQRPISVCVTPNLDICYVEWDPSIPIKHEDEIKKSLAGPATEYQFCCKNKLRFLLYRLREHNFPRKIDGTIPEEILEVNKDVKTDMDLCANMTDEELADFIEKTFTEQYFSENADLINDFAMSVGRKCRLDSLEIQQIFNKHNNKNIMTEN